MKNGLSALAGWLALTIVALDCGAPAMARARSSPAICEPFGDPPAIFIGVVKPDCLHGTLLGPWKDPDGNDRYACLWEPYPAASKRRLPMVIYLHPSLFGPGLSRKPICSLIRIPLRWAPEKMALVTLFWRPPAATRCTIIRVPMKRASDGITGTVN